MTVIGYPLGALLGLVIGSVIWVLADKQIRGALQDRQVVCLSCGERKSWRGWLPLSWLSDASLCSHCGYTDAAGRRRWEIAIAAYGVAGWAFSSAEEVVPLLVASAPLLLILNVDLKVQAVFLPDCYVAVVLGIFLGLIDSTSQAAGAAIGMGLAMVMTALFLVITRWIFRSLGVRTTPMGITDIYVAAAVGAIVRFDGLLPALVVAVTGAALCGTIMPIARPGSRTRLAAFGPFLCLGGLVALLL
ncbi:MAG: hypothetical protein AB7G88_08260 [Thermomicrobiales bacterium]